MLALVVLKVITEKNDNTTNNNSSDLDPEYWIKDTTIECNEGTGIQEPLLISPAALVRFIKALSLGMHKTINATCRRIHFLIPILRVFFDSKDIVK